MQLTNFKDLLRFTIAIIYTILIRRLEALQSFKLYNHVRE